MLKELITLSLVPANKAPFNAAKAVTEPFLSSRENETLLEAMSYVLTEPSKPVEKSLPISSKHQDITKSWCP
jgi:hypothetical protein